MKFSPVEKSHIPFQLYTLTRGLLGWPFTFMPSVPRKTEGFKANSYVASKVIFQPDSFPMSDERCFSFDGLVTPCIVSEPFLPLVDDLTSPQNKSRRKSHRHLPGNPLRKEKKEENDERFTEEGFPFEKLSTEQHRNTDILEDDTEAFLTVQYNSIPIFQM